MVLKYIFSCHRLFIYVPAEKAIRLKCNSFNGLSVFKKLKSLTEAPFSVYADLDNHIVISASPERFIKKTGDQLLSQPIKGTAKRTKNKKEDASIVQQLKNDPKERTENIMSTRRTWDETMSPQWKYLHQQESARKRGGRKTAARLRREEEENNTEKWKDINSELKKEKVKYDIKRTTRLSTESKEQE